MISKILRYVQDVFFRFVHKHNHHSKPPLKELSLLWFPSFKPTTISKQQLKSHLYAVSSLLNRLILKSTFIMHSPAKYLMMAQISSVRAKPAPVWWWSQLFSTAPHSHSSLFTHHNTIKNANNTISTIKLGWCWRHHIRRTPTPNSPFFHYHQH